MQQVSQQYAEVKGAKSAQTIGFLDGCKVQKHRGVITIGSVPHELPSEAGYLESRGCEWFPAAASDTERRQFLCYLFSVQEVRVSEKVNKQLGHLVWVPRQAA